MGGDSVRKANICKQDAQAVVEQGHIPVRNMEAYLDRSDGEGIALDIKIRTSMNDVVAGNIAESSDLSSCEPASKRQQFLSDAVKGSEFSVRHKPLRTATNTKESQLSEPGRRHHSEKAVLEVTRVCHSKKGGTQPGIMDFLTVQEKKQGSKQGMPLTGSLKSKGKQTINKLELHGNTRIKKRLNDKEEAEVVSTINLPPTETACGEGYALRKEDDQKLLLLNSMGIKCNQESELIQSDSLAGFFLPASKKCRLQRRPGAANAPISDCIKARKNDGLGLRGYAWREENIAEPINGSAVTILKPPPNNEDFFKRASMKQRQKMAKETTVKFENLTKAESRDESYLEFDLHMEAKLALEENAQLCAGKPIHPFFSQQKTGHQALSFCGTVGDAPFTPMASILEVEDLTPAPPFHVNQLPETRECEAGSRIVSSTLFERKKDQCAFEVGHRELCMLLKRPFLGKSCQTSRSFSQSGREDELNEHLECTVLERLIMFLKDLEKDSKHEEKGEEDQLSFTEVGLEERLKLYHSDHAKGCSGGSLDFTSSCTEAGSASRNLLWTDVYQPCLPEQVCGNRDLVKFLSVWLQSWHEGCGERRRWSEEDSDCGEDSSHDYSLQNVSVLVGPVGCGKTAAIYACAKAHGYTVIEVNCSDNRSGALIKQKFSEAMESHRLCKWSAEATVVPLTKRKLSAKSDAYRGNTFVIGEKKAEQVDGQEHCRSVAANSNSKHTGRRQSPCKHTHSDSVAENLGENGASRDNKDMTILLFEDVDLVFEDDRGFMAAVAQVAATAKRPIILTSNDKELYLPHNLYAHLLEFRRPSTKDLLSLAYLVCIAEGIICSPGLLHRIVNICNHDTRKMLNYLQFWCQGRCHARPPHTEFKIENERVAKNEKEPPNVRPQESDSAEITTLFNLEAQHRLWPSYIYQSFPCGVTESVACRLNEVISLTQANHRADREKKLVQEVVKKRVLLGKMKRRMIDSPSKVGINHTCEWEEENDDEADETVTAEEFSFSDSPVNILEKAKTMAQLPVSSRKIRRQLAIVMSDSDDDTPGGTHEEWPHQDGCYLHIMHEPSSSLVSVRTTEDVGPISALSTCKTAELTPFSSGLHVEASTLYVSATEDATHSSETLHTENSRSHSLDYRAEELGSNQGAPCIFKNTSEPVHNLWSHFQNYGKDKDGLQLSTASKESFSVVMSLSDLSDNLSACDIMSCVHSSKQDVTKDAFMFSACEDPECCSQLQICAQVAHKSFQACIWDSFAISGIMEEIGDAVSIEEMMLAMNDPFTIGKLATNEKQSHDAGFVRGQAGPYCQEQELIRLRKRFSLQNSLSPELPARAQQVFLGASFYETVSFLAQMAHPKQDSLALGSTRQSRTRGYQSQLCSYPWNLSENSVTILQSFGSFGRL